MENETKAWWQSAGVWGGVIGFTAGLANMAGYTISSADQAFFADVAMKGVGMALAATEIVAGIMAAVGRIRATKRIG